MTRFFFADPGLRDDMGHHANHCRYVTRAAQARGIPVAVMAHSGVSQALQSELSAVPFFRAFTYINSDGDPICGWMNAFFSTADITRQDLARLDLRRDDVVFLSGAQPAQLMAVLQWAATVKPDRLPLVIVELGGEPGVDLRHDGPNQKSFSWRDPRTDARATLFRFAAQGLQFVDKRRIRVISLDPSVSGIYTDLMGHPVGVLPFTTPALGPLRSRVGKRPVTIATLGLQCPEKGYHFMPDVVPRVLQAGHDVRFLLHNSDAGAMHTTKAALMRETQEKLRALAKTDLRVLLDERVVNFEDWTSLVAASDLLLCPYDPVRYAASHSGMASTAVANGLPFVFHTGTSLARWSKDFGGTGLGFDDFTADAVAGVTIRALDRFDHYAECAMLGAQKWACTEGPENCIAAILALR